MVFVMTENRLSKTLVELIKIESFPYHEKDLASYLLNRIQSMGYPCYEDDSKEKTGSNTGNIIVDLTKNNGRKIVFCSHMDTINLVFPPMFQVSDESIKSTGTTAIGIDNKAGISIMLEILEHYKDQQDSLTNVIFVFTTCEEECFYGAKQVESKLLENAFIYVLDSGGGPIGDLINEGAGQTSLYISVFGEASHISGYTGVNAIFLAIKN